MVPTDVRGIAWTIQSGCPKLGYRKPFPCDFGCKAFVPFSKMSYKISNVLYGLLVLE